MDLNLTERKCEPGVTVIELEGRLTFDSDRGRIEAAVLGALNRGERRIVIDLSRIVSIDSTGIGVITFCSGRIKERNAEGSVAGARGLVLGVFRNTGIDRLLQFYPDLATACAGFSDASIPQQPPGTESANAHHG
jgi:anti-sigma B factor antagonist